MSRHQRIAVAWAVWTGASWTLDLLATGGRYWWQTLLSAVLLPPIAVWLGIATVRFSAWIDRGSP